MCMGGKAPKDNSAALAAQSEAERQARVRAARGEVDTAFAGFTPGYYDDYKSKYSAYYKPQLEEQYGDARHRLITQLADTGNLAGSEGARLLGKFNTEYKRKGDQLVDNANAAANDKRAAIENERGNLYNLSASSQDPAMAGAQAAVQASTLQAPPVFSPLANAFAEFFNNASIAVANERKGFSGTGTGLFRASPTSGSGSARYV